MVVVKGITENTDFKSYKMINIRTIQVSVFSSYYCKTPMKTVSLYDALFNLADPALVDEVRQTENHEERKKKKSHLPSFTPSGLFENLFEGAQPKIYSGFMCIDIDKDHNPNMDAETVKWELAKISQVAYCGLSVSGQGLFLLIPIETPECYRQHYEYFSDMLMYHFGLKADNACKNIGRLRVASYDKNPHINLNAKVLKRMKEEPQMTQRPIYQNPTYTNRVPFSNSTADNVDRYIQHLLTHHIDITNDYNTWFKIGCAFADEFGEAGRERFHYVSSMHQKYTRAECDNKFNDILKIVPRTTIGSFFYICHQAGIPNFLSQSMS